MSLPNGPKTPAMWQVFHWIAKPISFMRGCASRYGDCFTAMVGERMSPVVVFSNPQALQIILTGDDSEVFDAPGELNTLFEPSWESNL
jgi:cytochrome P450 family 110